jgi:hypothetical protein
MIIKTLHAHIQEKGAMTRRSVDLRYDNKIIYLLQLLVHSCSRDKHYLIPFCLFTYNLITMPSVAKTI